MPGLGGLAGLSGAYSGYNQGVSEEATARAKKYAIDLQQAADVAFGRTLQAFNSQQQQPQPGQPPMPQPGGPPMPPPGQPPAPPPQMPMQQGQQQPMPQARPPMPVQPGAAPPPTMPQQPMGGAPAGPPQMPGGQPGGQPGMQGQPTLDWRVVFQKVQQANPDAPPQVLAAAVDKFLPLMSQMAQQQWREVSQQLRAMQIQQGEERVRQGEERIAGTQANLGERQREFDIRERRLESSAAIRQDQGWQRLEIQKQQLERQITEGNNKQLLGQWRAVLDAQHKRAMEIIQSSSGFSALDPKEKKALLDEQNKAYNEAIERMRSTMGSSTGSGGTSDMPGPKAQEAAPKSTAVPGTTPKAGFDRDAAKKAGYTDAEIDEYLKNQ
jgi:hypothetical protein